MFISGLALMRERKLCPSNNPLSLHKTPRHDIKIGVWVAISKIRIVLPNAEK